MRFKLDENLGKGHANLLRLAGFDAHTVPDEGLEGSTDFEVIRAARDEGRCLITLDLDFSNPLAFPPSEYRGIILLRCGPRTDPVSISAVVSTLLEALRSKSTDLPGPDGHLWIVEPGRVRVYQPPA